MGGENVTTLPLWPWFTVQNIDEIYVCCFPQLPITTYLILNLLQINLKCLESLKSNEITEFQSFRTKTNTSNVQDGFKPENICE